MMPWSSRTAWASGEAHASFARVAGADHASMPQRHTFRQWLRAGGAPRPRTLALRGTPRAQDALESLPVTACSFSPAIEVVRRVSGWVRSQKLELQQMGGSSGSRRFGARARRVVSVATAAVQAPER